MMPGAAAIDPAERLGLDLADELARRWRTGEPAAAEEILSGHLDAGLQPEAAVDVIYEEYCLRQAAGEERAEDDILRRFPQWAGPLRVMFECHRRLLQGDAARPQFPAAGERVGGFTLLTELARGSHGRVFLASQAALSDRPVVLKIIPLDSGEHCSLARLQHTNIVPLYSVLDDPERGVRVLCMPYFGRATLGSLIEPLAGVPLDALSGRHVVATIDELEDASDAAVPTDATAAAREMEASRRAARANAARQMLERVSYAQAMTWVTACLADALQFAHERGLLHLDLKPSNVLLATDGQPMLLDFHLARGPVLAGGPLPESFGGTPAYMPEEQRAAMQALREGRPPDVTVDAGADIYALGAMLYEALGGRVPLTADSPPLARVNAQVSRGLSDIVARCVALRRVDRYPDALTLADDLRRHLNDQRLVGVPNRSATERWQKWRRRRPGRLGTAGMVVCAAAVLATLAAGAWSNRRDRRAQAEGALRDGQKQLADGHLADAVVTFERGLALAERLPLERDLPDQLGEQLTTAKRLRLADQVHQLADQARALYGSESASPESSRALAAQCEAFWQRRNSVAGHLRPAEHPQVAADLQEIAIFVANVRAAAAAAAAVATAEGAGRRQAIQLLDEAEAMFGPSAVLDQERVNHGRAAGLTTAPRRATTQYAAMHGIDGQSAWVHYSLGRALLAAGDGVRAADELAMAVALEPAGRWSNFYYGVCAYRMGRYQEAVAAFSVCIGVAPNVAGYFQNRALAYAALGMAGPAAQDYEHARQLDPAGRPVLPR
jgi:serine/threonine protein kinase/tetratricopeptide (TPR) repeat protein